MKCSNCASSYKVAWRHEGDNIETQLLCITCAILGLEWYLLYEDRNERLLPI